MTIAVTGSTGQLGRLVIKALQGADVVALARNPEKASDLGIPTRKADYNSVEMLERALQGVDTLLLISSSEVGQRAAQHRNVITAAQSAAVSRIVYTSLLHADSSPLSLAVEHRETEQMLKDSGLRTTILRNGWYTENYAGSIPAALSNGALIGSVKDGRISSASRADYALAAAKVVTTDGHDGKVYELAGDDSYTLTGLATEISRQTGRDIPYRDLPEAEYAAALEAVGLPKPLAAAIASWDSGASQGALFDDSKQLSSLIGRPTTPMRDVVATALAGVQADA
ncbi:SDR family oxidoreductase [Paracoccus aestuariivivens]|uniref:NAD(P)H-binding protein n=1 Tax=Paracoccus aestuariivivens TaxID=1820333 RepID=A0A6L6JCS5_9RHOB|nr:SDR family oxidoreductase [Paracoccus aestuariivivens]MTH77954.1 NAD(P)H-binding protein [Paracoccus aestuariivivens]